MPKVSIIIPVYNVEKYLRQCLDSIVNQTLKDIEIICIDDCSSDNSLNILEEYAKNDQRFVIIKQETNQGQGVARNIGIEKARGEYIGFVDPDDWIELDMYKEMYEDAAKNDTDITICDFTRYNEASGKNSLSKFLRRADADYQIQYLTEYNSEDKEFFKDTLLVLPMAVWHKIYRTDFVRKHSIKFLDIHYLEDVIFNLDAFLHTDKISYVNKIFYNYRIRQNSTMRKNIDMTDMTYEIFDCVFDILNRENIYTELEHNFKFFIIFTLNRVGRNKPYMYRLKLYNKSKKYLDKNALRVLRKRLFKDIWENIFSIKNEKKGKKQYKVIRILGIKIKHRKS